MADQRQKGISLQVGLSTAFIVIVIFTSIILSVGAFINIQKNMRQDLRDRIHDYIGTAALLVDADRHSRLQTIGDEKTRAYAELKRTLQEIRDKGIGVKFVYTMRKDAGNRYFFVVDAETNSEDMSHIGDEYPVSNVTPVMAQAFSSGTILVEKEVSGDRWGSWLSGFAPVRDSAGGLECMIGADVSADYIHRTERRAIILMSLFILIVTLAATVAGFVIAGRITIPLRIIAKNMAEVRRFQLDGTEMPRSSFIEIRLISSSFDGMRTGLRSFRRYVPAELVRKLITVGNEAKLGGEKKELSILFTDIYDFTSITERMAPEKLSYALEKYLGLMSSLIESGGGTIDKFIGDAVMAFWGAPIAIGDHALVACRTVLKIRSELKKFNDGLQAEGLERLETRFGINTGPVIVGNFGYENRMNYTILGDHVNLASRLESLNKVYGSDILISEHTAESTRHKILFRLMDKVAVKGRSRPTHIYHPIGVMEEVSLEQRNLVEETAKAFEAYAAGNWVEARRGYASILQRYPDDNLARLFLDRCGRLEKAVPAADWDGTTILNEK